MSEYADMPWALNVPPKNQPRFTALTTGNNEDLYRAALHMIMQPRQAENTMKQPPLYILMHLEKCPFLTLTEDEEGWCVRFCGGSANDGSFRRFDAHWQAFARQASADHPDDRKWAQELGTSLAGVRSAYPRSALKGGYKGERVYRKVLAKLSEGRVTFRAQIYDENLAEERE